MSGKTPIISEEESLVRRAPGITCRTVSARRLPLGVPKGHLVHFILDVVEEVDLSTGKINHRGRGSEQYPPSSSPSEGHDDR